MTPGWGYTRMMLVESIRTLTVHINDILCCSYLTDEP